MKSLLRPRVIETSANTHLLQISISGMPVAEAFLLVGCGMPVAEAFLTPSYSVSPPIRFLFLDLIASSQKMHSHTFC